MLESKFKTKLIKNIKKRFPGCMIFHGDPNETQGITDLIILHKDRWASLEGKKSANAPLQSNQQYYVDIMNEMSFSRIVYPENEEEVLNDLQQAFDS